MSRGDLNFIRRSAATFNRGELSELMEIYVDESEWVMPPEWPEERTYRGIDRIHGLAQVGPQGFDNYRFEEERLQELGEGRVLGLWMIRANAKGTSTPVETPFGAIYEIRREGFLHTKRKLLRVTAFFSWKEAEAAAAGLSAQ